MDEKPDQIIGHIEAQREQLGRHLNELETRVRQTTDWRTYWERNPMLFMGAALGGGVMMGALVGGRRSGHSSYRDRDYRSRRENSDWSRTRSSLMGASAGATAAAPSQSSTSQSPATPRKPIGPATAIQKSKINESVDHVKAALIAFGIAKAKEFISQVIPGLEQHLHDAEQSKPQGGSPGSSYNYGSAHAGQQDFRSHAESQSYRSTQSREPVGAGTPGVPS